MTAVTEHFRQSTNQVEFHSSLPDYSWISHPDQREEAKQNLKKATLIDPALTRDYLSKLQKNQWDIVLNNWPQSPEGLSFLQSNIKNIPYDDPSYLSPITRILTATLSQRNLHPSVKARSAVYAWAIAIHYDRPSEQGSKELNYGSGKNTRGKANSEELKLCKSKADNYLHMLDAQCERYGTNLPNDINTLSDLVSQVIIETAPFHVDIFKSQFPGMMQFKKNWNFLVQAALRQNSPTNVRHLHLYWDVVNSIVSNKKVDLNTWVMLPTELTTSALRRIPRQIKGVENLPKKGHTSIEDITYHTLDYLMFHPNDRVTRAKLVSFLQHSFSRNQQLTNELVHTLLESHDFRPLGELHSMAQDLFLIFHESVGAASPPNIDALVREIQYKPNTALGWAIPPNSNPLYAVVYSEDDDGQVHLVNGIVKDPDGYAFPSICYDKSHRSADYLGLFLQMEDVPSFDIIEPQLKAALTGTLTHNDLPILKSLAINAEKRLQNDTKHQGEFGALLLQAINKLSDLPVEKDNIPLILSFIHLIDDDLADQGALDSLFDLLDAHEKTQTFGNYLVLAQVREFFGYHLLSPGIEEQLKRSLKFIQKEVEYWSHDFNSSEENLANLFIQSRYYYHLLNPSIHWRWRSESDDSFDLEYRNLIQVLQKKEERVLENISEIKLAHAIFRKMFKNWADKSEVDKTSFSFYSTHKDEAFPLYQVWETIAGHSSENDTFTFLADEFLPWALAHEDCQLYLNHLFSRPQLDPKVRSLLLEAAFSYFGFPVYPTLVNFDLLSDNLGLDKYIGFRDGEIGVFEDHSVSNQFPTPLPSDKDLLFKGEIIGTLDDHTLLNPGERISRFLKRNKENILNTSGADRSKLLSGLSSPKLHLLPLPQQPRRVALFDSKEESVPKSHYPRLNLFRGSYLDIKNQTGVAGTLFLAPGLGYSFTITRNGIASEALLSSVQNPDDFTKLETSILVRTYNEVVSGAGLADRITKLLLNGMPTDAPKVGMRNKSTVRWGYSKEMNEELNLIPGRVDAWNHSGKGIIMTSGLSDLGYWDDWRKVVAQPAEIAHMTPENYIRNLMKDMEVNLLIIGREINPDKESGEVSRRNGVVKFQNPNTIPDTNLPMSRVPHLQGLSYNSRPTVNNIAQAQTFGFQIPRLTLLSVNESNELVENVIYLTFSPPNFGTQRTIKPAVLDE